MKLLSPNPWKSPFAALQAVAAALDLDADPGDLFQVDGGYKAGEGARLDAYCGVMTTWSAAGGTSPRASLSM